MPNRTQSAKKNNRRRRRQTGSQRVAPTTEELEQQYQSVSNFASQNSTNCKDYRKKFEEASPNGVEFQIIKHKNLIRKKEEAIQSCHTGLTMARMGAILHGTDKPEHLEKFEKHIKLGEDRINDLTNWVNHSKLMVKLFTCFVKGSILNEKIAVLNHTCQAEVLKKILDEIKDNIHKVLEGVEVMVQYGSDFYTEGEYNDLAVMFKDEYELWSGVCNIMG